jgi:hypothetical protein
MSTKKSYQWKIYSEGWRPSTTTIRGLALARASFTIVFVIFQCKPSCWQFIYGPTIQRPRGFVERRLDTGFGNFWRSEQCSLWHQLFGFDCRQQGANPLFGLVVGAAIGGFFGLLFSGVKGRWVDAIYGPEPREESECPTELPWHHC